MKIVRMTVTVSVAPGVLQDSQLDKFTDNVWSLKEELEATAVSWVKRFNPKRELFFDVVAEETT